MFLYDRQLMSVIGVKDYYEKYEFTDVFEKILCDKIEQNLILIY